jgi:hypothetical protein
VTSKCRDKNRAGKAIPPLSQTAAARILRVPRETLNRAIRGTRPNARLLALYNNLLAHSAQNKTAKRKIAP